MQIGNKNPSPGRLPLIAALALLSGAGAWADEPSPWYIGASQSLTRDSNVYRLANGTPDPDGKSRGDNYSSTGLLGGFDQAIGRQRLYATANLRYNKYQDHDRLDNTSFGVNAGWDWATINKLSGSVNVSANSNLATFGGNTTQQTTDKNVVKTDQISTSVRWGGVGRLAVQGDYAHSRVSYSAPAYLSSESSADTGSLGTFYSLSPDLKLGGAVRLTRTVSPNGIQLTTTPATYASNTTNGRNLDLTADWQYSVQTGVSARLSWTRQTNSSAAATGQDFSGLTGSLTGRFAPTGKLTFNATYSRDAGTNGAFFNTVSTPGAGSSTALYQNSQVADAVSLGVGYAATAKITANAGYQYRRAKIANGLTGAGASDYTDSYRSASLGLTYAIARAWQLSCNLSHETRDVTSTPAFAYGAYVAGCAAQFTLR
jgi:hypothetical protein